ncbi:hypothetical protein [Nocardia goodfellowii]|uniref:Uncharacterized protein n=1 Tax=Nocardia goodfellowii TaxID=882446 RepID=A0ABS4QCT7_9NOCA|nr:hypothetical protein [Nocardia goodfellowii]MBP2189462.1 hypothetical protein [Nocardia goodfellowii]
MFTVRAAGTMFATGAVDTAATWDIGAGKGDADLVRAHFLGQRDSPLQARNFPLSMVIVA